MVDQLAIHRVGQGPRRLGEHAFDLFLLLPVEQENHRTTEDQQRQQDRGGERHEVNALFHDPRDLDPS